MKEDNLIRIFKAMLEEMFGTDIMADENFTETPLRMARMYATMFKPDDVIKEVADTILQKNFPSRYKGIVLLPDIRTVSFCPHHMLPVEYNITIAYLPAPIEERNQCRLVGASKPERVARALAARPVLQEQYTLELAEAITEAICPLAVGIIMQGFHSCMRIRGIGNPCANMITSEMTGAFLDEPRLQNELMHLIKWGNGNKKPF